MNNYNQGYGQGYDAPGYNAPGYGQDYNQSYGASGQTNYQQQERGLDIDPSSLRGDEDVNELLQRFLGGQGGDVPYIEVQENSARDLEGFDMDEFEREFGGADGGERGLFGFGGHGESKKSHQLIGGAAAWAAFKWYENWKLNTKGEKVNHSFVKKLLTAFAAAQAIKFAEQRSSSFQGGLPRDVAVREATGYASKISDMKYNDDAYNYDNNQFAVHGGGQAAAFDAPQGGYGGGYGY
ncbi:hypothetical protein IWW55_001615 [Coemansia sp. RSA 2706]|nr:hypothetical protein IWW55_001615 [Coemansia sp. RSA 2706]KAJ2311546.1 hypothetical protein IWW54_002582 [Coemansia sp. RSA 2705]